MNREKGFDRESIHRLLDGDLGPDEKKSLMEQIRSDPELREEFDGLAGSVRAVETSERVPAPPFFTAEVMRRLPQRKPGFGARIRNFLFQGRVLRWNMATALASLALFALVVSQVVGTRHAPVETAVVAPQEQAVTVTMKLEAPQAHQVSVAGTFNKWNADSHVMTKQANGIWTINIPLNPGEYSYMFIVDGKAWVTDPNAESFRDDGFGNKNAVVRVRT